MVTFHSWWWDIPRLLTSASMNSTLSWCTFALLDVAWRPSKKRPQKPWPILSWGMNMNIGEATSDNQWKFWSKHQHMMNQALLSRTPSAKLNFSPQMTNGPTNRSQSNDPYIYPVISSHQNECYVCIYIYINPYIYVWIYIYILYIIYIVYIKYDNITCN